MAMIARQLAKFAKKEIDQAFKQARRVCSHPGLTILVSPQQKEFGRILLLIPRKVGSAPERNRLRRRFKAIFYEEQLYTKGMDCIVIMRKPVTSLSFDELKALLTKALKN